MPGSFMVRQRFGQIREFHGPQDLNTAGPVYLGNNTYLIEETEPQDFDGEWIEWDRVWISLPAGSPRRYSEKGSFTKTYKKLFKQWNGNGTLAAVSIAARSATIQCDVHYDYYLSGETIPALPAVPDIAVNSVGNFTWVDNVNGFPHDPSVGSPPDTNNFVHFLSGSIDTFMGAIYVRKTIYG